MSTRQSKDYEVQEFSRTIWLISRDKSNATVWTIFPYRTNAVVGSVEADVYLDATMTQKDPKRSFRMAFYPETGVLSDFWWNDNHEVLFVRTNGFSSYGRDLGEKKSLEIRWDNEGHLVSSNVYNWAKRGKIIGGIDSTNRPVHRLGPTSAVEAATESWRQQKP